MSVSPARPEAAEAETPAAFSSCPAGYALGSGPFCYKLGVHGIQAGDAVSGTGFKQACGYSPGQPVPRLAQALANDSVSGLASSLLQPSALYAIGVFFDSRRECAMRMLAIDSPARLSHLSADKLVRFGSGAVVDPALLGQHLDPTSSQQCWALELAMNHSMAISVPKIQQVGASASRGEGAA